MSPIFLAGATVGTRLPLFDPGKMTGGAGWMQKTPEVWFGAGGVMLYVKHSMDVSDRHLDVRLAFKKEAKRW